MHRSVAATEDELLRAFFEHPEGIALDRVYTLVPGRHVPAGLIGDLAAAGKLTTHPTPGANPWGYVVTLSFEMWVKMTYAATEAERACGGSGTP